MSKNLIGVALILALHISLVVTEVAEANTREFKLDCLPVRPATEELCRGRGCIWEPVDDNDTASITTPWCYFPDAYTGYELAEVQNDGLYKFKIVRPSGFPDDIQIVAMRIEEVGENSLRVRIYDDTKVRYEPALPQLNFPKRDAEKESVESTFDYQLIGKGQFVIKRKSTGAVIFDTDIRKLIFSNQFIQINSKLNSPNVYGLGEHYDTFLKKSDSWKPYNFFNTNKEPLPGGKRTYGVFPFYINLDSDMKNAHGVYLKNSNAMDIIIQPDQSITFRPIGGILDFIIFGGPTPHDVVSEYQQIVGLPELPPRWSLGFHLCRFNYNSTEATETVWKRTIDAGIPFDVMWNDIDYMDRHNDFTYDLVKYKGLPEFVKKVHDAGMKYVILFDPGVSQEDNYEPYSLGMDMDIFVKHNNGSLIVGEVWNDSGRAVFPDFSNPKTTDYWTFLFKKFHETIPFDGAWIDMNDISNFVDGSIDGCPENTTSIDRPPYEPGFYPLIRTTLCLSARHKDGLEYDVHNLYSFYETIATRKALEVTRPNTRPFILSRSSSPGQGKYGGHWNGDLLSTWEYLKWSIPSIIEHSMYGFSIMGADICGFSGDVSPELCARWHVLGSFYTFTRNHNDEVSVHQDPVALGPLVVKAAKDSLLKKYSLLPYLYSLMHRANKYGEPIIRGTPFEFFPDPQALDVEDQFLWGRALLISPIVTQNTYQKSTYLSKGRWYETNIGLDDIPKRIDAATGYWHSTANVSLWDAPIFYRGGYILPYYQDPKMTTDETSKQPLSLLVALCEMSMAKGEVYLDQGDNVDGKFDHANFEAKENTLSLVIDQDELSSSISFHRVKVIGIDGVVKSVSVNKNNIGFTYSEGQLEFNIDLDLSRSSSIIADWSF